MSQPPSTRHDEPATQVRWWVFFLTGAISWLLYLHRYSWGVVKPYYAREHPELSSMDLGWLDSAFMATYGFGQIPLGLAGDLIGMRSILALSIGLWSVTVAAVAFLGGFWLLMLLRGLFGLCQAGAYPLISKVTRNWFPMEYRTTVQGTVTALGRAGGACAPILISTVLIAAFGLSWEHSLIALAVPGLALALVFWLTFRNSPAEHPWVNPAECRIIGTAVYAAGQRPQLRLTRGNLINFYLLLFYAFASTFADQLFVFWIPQFLKLGKGMSDQDMGLFASLPLIGGAVGGIVGGILNDVLIRKTGRRRLARSAIAFTGKAVAATFIALSVGVADGRLVMFLLLACKFFGDWSLSTQWGAITDVAGPAAGTVFGVVNTAGAIGGFLAGPVMGHVKDVAGWEGLFYSVAAIFFIAALCWLFIDCTRTLHEVPSAHDSPATS